MKNIIKTTGIWIGAFMALGIILSFIPEHKKINETAQSEIPVPAKAISNEIKQFIKINNLELTNAGNGASELDFSGKTTLSDSEEIDVLIITEFLTPTGYRSCGHKTRSHRYNLLPYTAKEIKEGVGLVIWDKDPENTFCDDIHQSPKYAKAMYPLIILELSHQNKDGEAISDKKIFPLKNTISFN